jgi:hypothetical protein
MEKQLIGKRISIPGQFNGVVTVEDASLVEDIVLLRVRTQQGDLKDAYIGTTEVDEILSAQNHFSEVPVDQ